MSAGGQAIVLEHFSLSLVLLNLKWTKVQSHRSYLLRDRFIRSYLPILKQDAQALNLFKLSSRPKGESSLVLLRQAYWKAACSKQTEHILNSNKKQAPIGNLVPSNGYQWGTVNGGLEQPGNKAGKGDTTVVTT